MVPPDMYKMSDSAIRRWINRVGGKEKAEEVIALREADFRSGRTHDRNVGKIESLKKRIENLPTPVVERRMLAISGHDVMRELSIPAGPAVGVALKRLEDAVIENPALNTREELLRKLKEESG